MTFKSNASLLLGVLLCVSAWAPAAAQTPVYQCGSGANATYSEKPCLGGRIVNTEEAPVPVKPNPKGEDARRAEQNRVLAESLRQRDGESAEQFDTRRRRARLPETDRAECDRIDKRMAVEEAGLGNPDKAQVLKAEAALKKSRKRFSDLKC